MQGVLKSYEDLRQLEDMINYYRDDHRRLAVNYHVLDDDGGYSGMITFPIDSLAARAMLDAALVAGKVMRYTALGNSEFVRLEVVD